MNNICTSIEQSKKLIELGIDVNTADMCYCPTMNIDSGKNEGYLKVPECYPFSEVKDSLIPYLPAWSLSALLGLMPKSIKGITASDEETGWPQYFYYPRLLLTDKEMWQCIYKEYNGAGASKCWTIGESPIDACVEMILKLHELNLL